MDCVTAIVYEPRGWFAMHNTSTARKKGSAFGAGKRMNPDTDRFKRFDWLLNHDEWRCRARDVKSLWVQIGPIEQEAALRLECRCGLRPTSVQGTLTMTDSYDVIQLRLADGYEFGTFEPTVAYRAKYRLAKFVGRRMRPKLLVLRGSHVDLSHVEAQAIRLVTRISPLDVWEYERMPNKAVINSLVERGILERHNYSADTPQFASLIRRPDCSQLFIVLTGAQKQMSSAHDTFLTDTQLIDRNLLILRDVGMNQYVEGLSSAAPSFGGLVSWLDGVRHGLGITRDNTYLIGNSIGGFASILLGHYLEAGEVWAFAPPCTRPDKFTRSPGGFDLDLEVALAEHNERTRFHIFFNSSHERDSSTAERFGAMPGVILHPQQGNGHGLLPQFLAGGHGRTLLPPYRRADDADILASAGSGRTALLDFLSILTGAPQETIREQPLALDSLAMVQVIDFAETRCGVRLPNSTPALLNDGSFEDLWALIEASPSFDSKIAPLPIVTAAPKNPTGGRERHIDGRMVTDIEVGMPLTGRNNLGEAPLLKLAGDLQWRHTAQLSGVPSAETVDDEGNRLYATFYFVECVMPEPLGMAAFGENDQFSIVSSLSRFGSSMLEGEHVLAPLGADTVGLDVHTLPVVRLSNSFVRQWEGAGWLKKSRPASARFALIPELHEPPEAYRLLKTAGNGQSILARPLDAVALIDTASTIEMSIEPDRDLNGAGLLYFANYPVFLDMAERTVLSKLGLDQALLDRRSLLHRRSAYLSNASADDTLEVSVLPSMWAKEANESGPASIGLHVELVMCRRSDGRQMMVSSARKTFSEVTPEDVAAVLSLIVK